MKKIIAALAGSLMLVGVEAKAHEPERESSVNILPPGTIVAYIGPVDNIPDGWAICGGNGGERNLDGRYLVGTTDFDKVGYFVNPPEHDHGIDIRTTGEAEGWNREPNPETADNWTGKNWHHTHDVKGTTGKAQHVPPSVMVLFLCKQ